MGTATAAILCACNHAQEPPPYTPTPDPPSSTAHSGAPASTPSSPKSSTTVTPTKAKPALAPMPAAAKVYSAAGLQAFVTWWISATDYAQNTGNSLPMANSCTRDRQEYCSILATDASAVWRAGGYYVVQPTTVTGWVTARVTPPTSGYALARIHFGAATRVVKVGAKPVHGNGENQLLTVDARFSSGRWIVYHSQAQPVSG